MLVIDYLEKLEDARKVLIIEDGEVVSYYDGKDSIDEVYNDREVLRFRGLVKTRVYHLYI